MITRFVLTAALISACGGGGGGADPVAPAAPTIGTFAAGATTIMAGQSTSLIWTEITGATTCSIDHDVGIVQCVMGMYSTPIISPTSTTTYTFIATGVGGTATKSATVVVAPATFVDTLTLESSPASAGIVSASPPGPAYQTGTVVTVTAVKASGYTFVAWSGACTGSGACSVIMNANKSVTAIFAADARPPRIDTASAWRWAPSPSEVVPTRLK